MTEATDLQEVGERLERILGELHALADPSAGERATEAVRLVTELYGAALSTMLELVVDAGDVPLLDKMVTDPLVSSLLVLHDLHPFDLAARIGLAFDKIRPYLASHGGDVEVLDVNALTGSVTIRLLGSCDGCPSSSVTLKMAVEQAIHEGAPEVVHIVVDGWVEPEAPPVPAVPIELRPKPVSIGAAG